MRRELLINRPMPRSGVKFLEEKEARDERGMQLLQVSMKNRLAGRLILGLIQPTLGQPSPLY